MVNNVVEESKTALHSAYIVNAPKSGSSLYVLTSNICLTGEPADADDGLCKNLANIIYTSFLPGILVEFVLSSTLITHCCKR